MVLLPEHPEQSPSSNPCLRPYTELPDFTAIGEADCYYGLGQLLMEYESAVCSMEDMMEGGERDWAALMETIEAPFLAMESAWNTVNLLNITTDKLDMDRFQQLMRRADRALLTRYGSLHTAHCTLHTAHSLHTAHCSLTAHCTTCA